MMLGDKGMPTTASDSAYLTLPEARAEIDRAIAEARENGEAAAVVIVDAGGWVVAAVRGDDASLDSLHQARRAARRCARGNQPRARSESVRARPLVKGGRAVAAIGIAFQKLEGSGETALPLGLPADRRYSDRAIAEASRVGCPVGVAVVDELGRVVCVDRMDGSSLG